MSTPITSLGEAREAGNVRPGAMLLAGSRYGQAAVRSSTLKVTASSTSTIIRGSREEPHDRLGRDPPLVLDVVQVRRRLADLRRGQTNNLEVVKLASYTYQVRIQASREFGAWFENIKKERGPALARATALLGVLRDLPLRPTDETASLKRVRQATRHEIWRVAHPFDPEVAVRCPVLVL